MPKPNEQQKYKFSLAEVTLPDQVEGEKRRRFSAVVYSGGRIDNHGYWGRDGVVIDLSNIQFKAKTGLIEEHIGGFRVGVATQTLIENKVQISGHFLSNKRAQEVIQDADEEFPFQMSWWADPEFVEEIPLGRSVVVNEQTFNGPVTIFRNVRIHEYTICTTGADTSTSIEAFSGKPKNIQQEDTSVTELEQAQAKIQELEQKNTQLEADAKKFAADKREAEITALIAETQAKFTDEELTEMKGLDDKSFAFSASQVRKFSANTPQKAPLPSYLTQHQAGGDQNQFNAKSVSLADQAKARK